MVLVLRLLAPRRYRVNVDVERQQLCSGRTPELERKNTGLLAGLAQRDLLDTVLTVGVSPRLQPAIQLAVVPIRSTTAASSGWRSR